MTISTKFQLFSLSELCNHGAFISSISISSQILGVLLCVILNFMSICSQSPAKEQFCTLQGRCLSFSIDLDTYFAQTDSEHDSTT